MNPEYESGEHYAFNWKFILVLLTSMAMWVVIVGAVVIMMK